MPAHALPLPDRRLRGALLLLVASTLASSGCCGFGTDNPAPASSSAPAASSAPSAGAAPSGPVSDALPLGTPAPTATAERQIAGAAHILVAYKGAERAPKTVTRSKDDAKKRATEVLGKLKEGKSTFEDLVKQYTDDEISKAANGAVGNFERNAMPPAFADATFAMKVGDLSEVVETPQGFHLIKRTK
jgi:peptidyl-prolyl cis-trans isomerase NIMA-interacting 1